MAAIAALGGIFLIVMGFVMHHGADMTTPMGGLNKPSTAEVGLVFVLVGVVLAVIGA
jgi:hypothetical protein